MAESVPPAPEAGAGGAPRGLLDVQGPSRNSFSTHLPQPVSGVSLAVAGKPESERGWRDSTRSLCASKAVNPVLPPGEHLARNLLPQSSWNTSK